MAPYLALIPTSTGAQASAPCPADHVGAGAFDSGHLPGTSVQAELLVDNRDVRPQMLRHGPKYPHNALLGDTPLPHERRRRRDRCRQASRRRRPQAPRPRAMVVSRGVVDFGRSVVIVSDSIGGVRQDASSRLLPPSTSLVGPSSGARSSSAMEPSAR